jgi:hypothetical protein
VVSILFGILFIFSSITALVYASIKFESCGSHFADGLDLQVWLLINAMANLTLLGTIFGLFFLARTIDINSLCDIIFISLVFFLVFVFQILWCVIGGVLLWHYGSDCYTKAYRLYIGTFFIIIVDIVQIIHTLVILSIKDNNLQIKTKQIRLRAYNDYTTDPQYVGESVTTKPSSIAGVMLHTIRNK